MNKANFNNEVDIPFYDLKKCVNISGVEKIVQFSKYFNDVQYCNSDTLFSEYLNKETLIIRLLLFIAEQINDDFVFVKYSDFWLGKNSNFIFLKKLFRKNSISLKKTTAICVKKPEEIYNIIQSILRYNTFAHIVFRENKIVFSPTDHMDIFIYGKDNFSVEKILELINAFSKKISINEIFSIK